MQIHKALDAFLLQLQADGRSEHTIGQYRRHVRLLEAWLAMEGLATGLKSVDHQVVARFLASPAALLGHDGRAKLPSSANALRTSLRSFLRFLHNAELTKRDHGRLIRRARCSPPPPRGLSEEDVARLLAVLESGKGRAAERDFALYHLLVATGLRVGSALALDVVDVDIANGELAVRTAKGGQRGRVFLGQSIREHLTRHLAGRTAGPLFQGRYGGQLCRRQVHARFCLWLERAGIQRPASPHSLRHSFATKLLASTGDLALTQRALLHRSVVSTMAYVTVADERMKAALEA